MRPSDPTSAAGAPVPTARPRRASQQRLREEAAAQAASSQIVSTLPTVTRHAVSTQQVEVEAITREQTEEDRLAGFWIWDQRSGVPAWIFTTVSGSIGLVLAIVLLFQSLGTASTAKKKGEKETGPDLLVVTNEFEEPLPLPRPIPLEPTPLNISPPPFTGDPKPEKTAELPEEPLDLFPLELNSDPYPAPPRKPNPLREIIPLLEMFEGDGDDPYVFEPGRENLPEMSPPPDREPLPEVPLVDFPVDDDQQFAPPPEVTLPREPIRQPLDDFPLEEPFPPPAPIQDPLPPEVPREPLPENLPPRPNPGVPFDPLDDLNFDTPPLAPRPEPMVEPPIPEPPMFKEEPYSPPPRPEIPERPLVDMFDPLEGLDFDNPPRQPDPVELEPRPEIPERPMVDLFDPLEGLNFDNPPRQPDPVEPRPEPVVEPQPPLFDPLDQLPERPPLEPEPIPEPPMETELPEQPLAQPDLELKMFELDPPVGFDSPIYQVNPDRMFRVESSSPLFGDDNSGYARFPSDRRPMNDDWAQYDHTRVFAPYANAPTASHPIAALARVDFQTLIQAPRLIFEVLGPQATEVGEELRLVFRVRNSGQVPARGTVFRIDLPENLEHPAGRELDYKVGTLAPGEIHEAVLYLTANRPGMVSSQAWVVCFGGLKETSLQNFRINPGEEPPPRPATPRPEPQTQPAPHPYDDIPSATRPPMYYPQPVYPGSGPRYYIPEPLPRVGAGGPVYIPMPNCRCW